MKIAVIGATGYVGNAVVQELAGRGHEVTAFARNTDKVFQAQNVAAVSADVNAADFADKLAGFDAVVSAFNPGWTNPNIGKYRLGKDDLLMDGEIPAGISVADLAIAIADDAENKAHLFERFTVAAA